MPGRRLELRELKRPHSWVELNGSRALSHGSRQGMAYSGQKFRKRLSRGEGISLQLPYSAIIDSLHQDNTKKNKGIYEELLPSLRNRMYNTGSNHGEFDGHNVNGLDKKLTIFRRLEYIHMIRTSSTWPSLERRAFSLSRTMSFTLLSDSMITKLIKHNAAAKRSKRITPQHPSRRQTFNGC